MSNRPADKDGAKSSSSTSKFRDNKGGKAGHVKSRNKDADAGLNNPSDLMFFNSNREKSPVPDRGEEARQQVLVNPESLASTGDESQFAGTGETGAPKSDKKASEKAKESSRRDSRIEQKTLQQSLINKFGKYDQVI